MSSTVKKPRTTQKEESISVKLPKGMSDIVNIPLQLIPSQKKKPNKVKISSTVKKPRTTQKETSTSVKLPKETFATLNIRLKLIPSPKRKSTSKDKKTPKKKTSKKTSS